MDWFDSEAPKPWGGKVGSKPKCFWNHLPWRITGCRLCPLHIFCPFFPGCWFNPGWQLTTLRLPALPVPVLPILPLGGNLLGHRLSLLSGMDGNHQGHPEHRLKKTPATITLQKYLKIRNTMRITCVGSGGRKSSRMWSMSTMVPANMANWILWDPGTTAKRLDRWLLGWIWPGHLRTMRHRLVRLRRLRSLGAGSWTITMWKLVSLIPSQYSIRQSHRGAPRAAFTATFKPFKRVLMHCSWHLVVELLDLFGAKKRKVMRKQSLPQNKLKL